MVLPHLVSNVTLSIKTNNKLKESKMTRIDFVSICNELLIDEFIALENEDLCSLLEQINNNGYNPLISDPKADQQVREFLINNF